MAAVAVGGGAGFGDSCAAGCSNSSTLSTSGRPFLPGNSGKRARATSSALLKSSTLIQASDRMRCGKSSSQSFAASTSNAPFRRWSTACTPKPVTAHCLPIQKMSRCRAIGTRSRHEKKIGVQTINADREDTVACAIRNSERGRAQKIASELFFVLDHLESAHVGLQDVGYRDGTALLLIRLHDRDQRAAHRGTGAVQCMHEARFAVAAARARIHVSRLEIGTNRAARDLAV